MSKPRHDPLLPVPSLASLLLALALVIAPHALRLPIWLTVLTAVCGAWRLLTAVRGEELPPAWLRTLLTVAVAVGVFGSFGTLLGRDAGTALLVGMTALKLLEMRRRRDTHVVLYLGYVLVGTQFLYSQELPTIVYLFVSVWLLTLVLIAVHQPVPRPRPWQYARLSAVMLLQALPIMLVLFVLFPRIPGPLWKLPDDAHAGTTGLSETMSPGDISQLSRSDAVAFRVEFDGPLPEPAQRYWRGPVLEAYDGRSWRRHPGADGQPASAELDGPAIGYEVLLEPSGQHWLFALDLPERVDGRASLNGAYELRAPDKLDELTAYRAVSRPRYRLDPALTPPVRARNLDLVSDRHPRARALAAGWRAEGLEGRQLLARATAFYTSRPFVYTLTPPRLEQDPVDEFLFETRRGFCEHYANSFAVLMRAAGLPARVVTGYQGGELNPVGGYMIVRQSDAHAWTEVWLPEEGWVRVDPTGFVAPQRVERGLADALPAGEPIPWLARRGGGWLRNLQLRWDAVNTGWTRWVLAYGPELQQRLLGRVGMPDWRAMSWGLAIALSAVIAALAAALLWRNRRPAPDPVAALFERYCRKLARRGLPRQAHEGPQDYAERVARQRPDLAGQVQRITQLYVLLRYGNGGHLAWQRRLRALVNGFRP